jgi:gamma-glutamyltranspeptidase/glutathione hydrolase
MKGLVSSGHPSVSEAAAEILLAGGNAFDAIVGAGFASTVAEPLLSSLGGGGFVLAHTADGEEVLFDFFASTPGSGHPGHASTSPEHLDFHPILVTFLGAEQTFHVGRASAAVPGTLKGLLRVHQRLGRLPLADVVQPATGLAQAGVVINHFQSSLSELLEPIIRRSPEALRSYAAEDGELLEEGARYRNHDLASFLEDLPGDPEAMYNGDLAEAVDRDMREGGGLVTKEDLRAYRVVERRPLSIQYRGLRVVTNPRPSLGGPLVALALSLQEAADLSDSSWGSAAHVNTLAVVLREVDRIRARGGSFPLPGDAAHVEVQDVIRSSTGGTTHMNVSDADGNVASFSTSNGEGCGVYVPGTGIMLNNMMGEDDLHPDGFHQGEPGSRISSMMSPSMLVDDLGVVAALGTGGSKRIRTALHQAITNLVDFNLPVDAAVNLPRLHLSEGTLHVEPGYPTEALDVLHAYGKVKVWEAQNVFFGGVHTVRPRTGEGAGDGRRAGHFMRVE